MDKCKCKHSIYNHWNDYKTLNMPTDCLVAFCDCKEYTPLPSSKSEVEDD